MRSPDSRLVEQIRRGDAAAGRRLVREHYARVYRFLLGRTGRPELAEDLTQETFVSAWRHLDTFDAGAPLLPWLLGIARRELLQALRRERPEASLEESAERADPTATTFVQSVELREALRRLPVAEREVVVLHYLEGYRCEEIARILDVPLGRVKHRLIEARARLRREWGADTLSPKEEDRL